MQTIKIGSRESRLAVIQAEQLVCYFQERNLSAKVVTMKTKGDRILDQPLEKIGGKGLFIQELEQALREKEIDFSVHSLKDVPAAVQEELPLLAYSVREDPRDVLVLPEGVAELDRDKPIGTSSRRRTLQAERLFPGMKFESVRGNVLTRLRKLDEGKYSGLILAAAGLKRLGLAHRIDRYFTEEEMIPGAGQGILAVQGRASDDSRCLQGYHCVESEMAAKCERTVIRELAGDCTAPVAAFAKRKGEMLLVTGMFAEPEGRQYVTAGCEGDPMKPEELGLRLAEKLRETYRELYQM